MQEAAKDHVRTTLDAVAAADDVIGTMALCPNIGWEEHYGAAHDHCSGQCGFVPSLYCSVASIRNSVAANTCIQKLAAQISCLA